MGKGGASAEAVAAATIKPTREQETVEVYLFGKRVDVTKFLKTHPGGSKALKIFQNRDAAAYTDRIQRRGASRTSQ